MNNTGSVIRSIALSICSPVLHYSVVTTDTSDGSKELYARNVGHTEDMDKTHFVPSHSWRAVDVVKWREGTPPS